MEQYCIIFYLHVTDRIYTSKLTVVITWYNALFARDLAYFSSGEYTPNCRFLKIINETRKGRGSRWLFLRIYKLECILLHTTFLSATVFSFYIFTFLMFRKLNKPQLTQNKQHNFIGIRVSDSRLYLDISRSFKWIESFIFRYFKVFQLSQMFTCGLSDLLLLTVGRFVSCFCIARIHFKSSHTRQFWT